jgi:DUF177 domain-containing protein
VKKALREYDVEFGGLGMGGHCFDFEVNKEFFTLFEYSEITEGNIKVSLKLLKNEGLMVMEFDLQGEVNIICDRCADFYSQDIHKSYRLIIKTTEKDNNDNDDDDVVYISPKDHQINVASYIYEYINLALPMRKVHPREEDCNQEVIQKFLEQKEQEKIDPRWEALKKIKK